MNTSAFFIHEETTTHLISKINRVLITHKEAKIAMAMMSGSASNDSFSKDPLTIHTAVSWNTYDNPCYSRPPLRPRVSECNKAVMDSELSRARAQIVELKGELELERKARRKAESANRKLVKEECKEKKGREELSRGYEELVKELEITRSEMDRLRKEVEDERKMMKMVEVFREERVQMKLTEAKLLYEEKYKKLLPPPAFADKHYSPVNGVASGRSSSDKSTAVRKTSSSAAAHKYSNIAIFSSAESGNPHIKQGIKGFVEFPKVVRAMGLKNKLQGTRLESQKSQIYILLKQKSPMKSCKLVTS